MIIRRDLIKEIVSYTATMTLVLLALLITNQLVHYLNDAANGLITMLAVLQVMALQVPILLGYMLPLALFLSLLLVLSRRVADHETVVLASCGFSPGQWLQTILLVAGATTLLVALIMFKIEPLVEHVRSRILAQATQQALFNRMIPHRFQSMGPFGAFYADQIDHKKLQHVWSIQQQQHNTWRIVYADSAQRIQNNNTAYFQFNHMESAVVTPGQKDLIQSHARREDAILPVSPLKINLSTQNASTTQVWRMRHLPDFGAELHWRLGLPISVMLLALLAAPLSQSQPRSSRFKKIFYALLVYIIYTNGLFLGRSWLAKGIIPFTLGLWWLHGLMLLLIAVLYKLFLFRAPR